MDRTDARRPRLARRLAIVLLVLCLPAGAEPGPGPSDQVETIRGKARAKDGDSLRVGRREVRLWGIDAPEFDQTCEREGRPWDCGGAARAALASRVDGRVVVCAPRDRDAYRRIVAVCRVEGRSINEWVVREGWAVDYRRYSGGAYAGAERQARKAARGIWSGRFVRPERFRQRQR